MHAHATLSLRASRCRGGLRRGEARVEDAELEGEERGDEPPAGLSARADSIEALGPLSNLKRDRLLHHHVRGLLLAARKQDAAAAEELKRAIGSWSFGYTRTNTALAEVLLRLGRPQEAIAALRPALHGSVEASNFYVSRTDIHEMLGQAWAAVGDPAARDSSRAHYAYVAQAWKRADPMFAARLQRAEAGAK